MTEHLLEMRAISKVFPGVRALQDVSLFVGRGETHALMGENGAGKSTLIKVLTGIQAPDAGEIRFEGRPIRPDSAADSPRPAIGAIYQELNLAPFLSVGENIFLGREPRSRGLIDWKTVERRSREILGEMGLDEIDVTRPLGEQSPAVQQMIAVARALCVEARLIVMDEPTSSLSEREVGVLFGVIGRLRERNISILFISHKMDEIFAICDRATVLRDGRLVGEYAVGDLTKLKLVSLMIGRDASGVLQGNQQKVLLARWLCKKPILMILDEPTRGIDVGAKSEIENLVAELAGRGVAVLMISSEMEELIRSCDRIAVLREGRKVGELAAREISEDAILRMIADGRDGSDDADES